MISRFLCSFALLAFFCAPTLAQPEVEALLYSTMPSASIHRPQMAMDGDEKTYFQSYYGMGGKDDFQILLSRPIPLRSLHIVTGDEKNQNLLTNAYVETSADGTTFKRAASFNETGVAEAALNEEPVISLRVRLNGRRGIPSLVLREITLDSPTKIGRVLIGPGRGFADLSQAPDLADWSRRAEKQMQEFWPDAAALLYSDGFIPPNKINMVYRTGPGVTGVAAVSGGEMEINSEWSRKQPNDTGLAVHEMAHVIQAMSAYNPVWLIEGIADYVRWVKFEPQNHRPRLNVQTASYRDSYRTTATFLAWCEMNYDSRLVTKLNHDVRFGNYKDELFKKYCGKDVNTLWAEFIEAYKKDPVNVITPPIALADRPRTLPQVAEGNATPVDLKAAFNGLGIVKDGAPFPIGSGFDEGGAAFSAQLLGATLKWNNVPFQFGVASENNLISCKGQTLPIAEGKYSSLWLLGAAVGGSQKGQEFLVTYTDGKTQTLAQHFSDWYLPRDFPGESRALKMDYRNMSNGARDPRSFYAYSYGFALDTNKTVQSLKLPDNPSIKILAVTLAK
ncbi:MAG TPA: basic secretory protein-like protein [Abditibacteriaceae bacterium]